MTSALPEAQALFAAAERDTGLSDYGDVQDPGFRKRVTLVLDNVRSRGLEPAAQAAASSVFLWHLTSRLRILEDRKRYPIAEERIVRPVIVMGEPRAGTTLLHALLGEDPGARPARF